jgi:hypothetical protein
MHILRTYFTLCAITLFGLTACGLEISPATGPAINPYNTQQGTNVQTVVTPSSPASSTQGLSAGPTLTSPRPTTIVNTVVSDPLVIRIVTGLQQRGFPIQALDVSRVALLQAAPGQAYKLGEGWLHIHLYASVEPAIADVETISGALKNFNPDWVAPPHFFQCDKLIVLYLGVEEQVVQALTDICAPPFYRMDFNVVAIAPTEAPLTSIDAALTWLLQSDQSIHATTPLRVRTQVSLSSGVALLYTYSALQDGQPVEIVRFSYLDWRDPVWYPDGDQFDIYSDNQPLSPVQFLMGTYVVNGGPDTPARPDTVVFAGGLVHDPAVQQVRVVFNDGSQDVVAVEQGAYLVAKLDVERVLRIEALDSSGTVLYQKEG